MAGRGRGGDGGDGGNSGDGGARGGRDGRRGKDGKKGRGDGGNRENEQGGAPSSPAATQEQSLPSDSLHQSEQPARPSVPPSPPMPPVTLPPPMDRSTVLTVPLPLVAPLSSWFSPNFLVFILSLYALLHSLQSVFRAAREAQQQRQGARQRLKRNLSISFQKAGQSDSSQTEMGKSVIYLPQKLQPSNVPRRRRTTDAVDQQGSLSRLAQNQGLPQQVQFNPQNFNAPGSGLSAGQVPVQGMNAELQAPTQDQLRTEQGDPTITAENMGSSQIQGTQPSDNITSRTQHAGREGPVNTQDNAEQMSNQREAQQGTTGDCTGDNSEDVDCGEDIPEAE